MPTITVSLGRSALFSATLISYPFSLGEIVEAAYVTTAVVHRGRMQRASRSCSLSVPSALRRLRPSLALTSASVSTSRTSSCRTATPSPRPRPSRSARRASLSRTLCAARLWTESLN
ncbi:hypothetical protein B0H19DRAFT_557419 [Mycena capillaripes]|nr:hypothetical protein B0H19DRAFT_557419 [Mycena capillaripes]